MPTFWMITNRKPTVSGFGKDETALSYWTSEETTLAGLHRKANWTARDGKDFKKMLAETAQRFRHIPDPAEQYKQKHVCLFVHGYNNDWKDAVGRYHQIATEIIQPANLGVSVLFTWPSDGKKVGYYPDRRDARRSADDLSFVFNELYKHLQEKQREAMDDPRRECRAKISVLAHSMGAYVVQKALSHAWDNQNQPLLAALINQMLLISADVDNDLFVGGERIDRSDGDAMANLCYRITCLYTGRDPVLGVSAGLKHFGKRRLGRSGLEKRCEAPPCCPDNVWDHDVSELLPADAENIHSATFDAPKTIALIQSVLRGYDRREIVRALDADGVPA